MGHMQIKNVGWSLGLWVRPREGGAQFDQLCDVMWNCALFAFYRLPREQCIAHIEKDIAVAMCSEQGMYYQGGGCQRYRDRVWYHVGEHTEAHGIDQPNTAAIQLKNPGDDCVEFHR